MKVSIVMPSFNQSSYVEEALNSIFSQNYKNWEILFVDGGSTDNTMQIVEKYRDRLAYCVSEPDKGQSDALRKGFSRATGQILTWLNTDDLLLPDALSEVIKAFTDKPERSWVLGNVIWINNKNIILKCWRGEGYTLGWTRLGLLAAGGPSAFFKRGLYERVGGINLDLHYQMDTELWWRFAIAGESFYRLENYTWALRLHEAAKVSGHMFVAKNDPRQQTVANLKSQETAHIQNLTFAFCIMRNSHLTKLLSLCRRLVSRAYLGGLFDNYKWRGKKLNLMYGGPAILNSQKNKAQ
jgi:glycosyltransferase involved in cell wall biosynthesis